MTYSFPILITQDKDGTFMAKVPALPGCHTQAKTLDILYKRIKEAMELCIEVQKSKKIRIDTQKFIGVQQMEVSI